MIPHRLLPVLLLLSGLTFGTKERPHLPCDYSGPISRKYPNTAFAMSSEAMKERAMKRVDISHEAKQLDIRGVVGVDVLVANDGSVLCAVGSYGHSLILRPVEEAVRQWKFKPLREGTRPVAYVGKLDFDLCNIGCGEAGPSMTLFK